MNKISIKSISVIAIFAIFVMSFNFLLTSKTLAQEVQCAPGTGTNSVPCEPCNPGPYNICVPDTAITDVFKEIDTLVKSDSQSLLILFYISSAIGLIFIINSILIYRKTLE